MDYEQLVPKTTRTHDNSYPRRFESNTTRAHDNSYPRRLVPKTTRMQDNSFRRRATGTQDNSYPRQLVPKIKRVKKLTNGFDIFFYKMHFYQVHRLGNPREITQDIEAE